VTPNSGSAPGTQFGTALLGAGNVRLLLFFADRSGGANQLWSLEVWGSST